MVDPGAAVTTREGEVLALLGEHLSHAEIAARLFISVRTVESHVAALRRKLQATDRRALVRLAVEYRATVEQAPSRLPAPPSSFVGRAAEVAALVEALGQARLVSAVGPGGVGKTRLALAVATEVAGRFPGGTWYVDLVPVTHATMVASAVAAVVGTGESSAGSTVDAVATSLRSRRATLLVLDNCEHLSNAVAVLAERLLTDCATLTVLVTSRIRLVVPFERIFPVPGMSESDAVALFRERAEAADAAIGDPGQVARVCAALSGMALAIELAAARLPALGLDGLTAGLSDQLGLLIGGGRLQRRHASIRDTLEWSYRLLDDAQRAVLRRVCVFAAPFPADAVAPVAGFAPAAALAGLCEHSLLARTGGRYRALEPVRQYAAAQRDPVEDAQTRRRHLDWCLATAADLDRDATTAGWAAALDASADDLRAALDWSATVPDARERAYRLAGLLAHLLFLRGRLRESQHRYEQAALLTADPAESLEFAAAVAKCRVAGVDAQRLDRAAAEAFLHAGNRPAAAVAFARAAEHANRFVGMYAEPPPAEAVETLLAAAREHAGVDPRARAAVLSAEANRRDTSDPVRFAGPAVDLARRSGDPLLVSAALDAAHLVPAQRGDIAAAAAMSGERVPSLIPLAVDPRAAFELRDALHTSAFTAVAAGDLPAARRYGEQELALPYLREEGDLATEDLFAPDALSGNWSRVLALSPRFLDAWQRSGRLVAPGRGIAVAAVALVHGLRGDDNARQAWLRHHAVLCGVPAAHASSNTGYGEAFDAILLLHRGRPDIALRTLTEPPTRAAPSWYLRLFHQWIAALRAEAAVLAGHPEAATYLRADVRGNPVATAMLRRAAALHARDGAALLDTAGDFSAAGCRYQHDRTLNLARRMPGKSSGPGSV